MAGSYDIFISYSNKDSHIVHQYAKFLENIGYKVWYDAKGLYGGVKFASEIANAIEACKLFVFFSSENSNKSEWTKGEIFLAQKYKKQILPVRIDDSEYEKSVMIVLLPLQYIVCGNGVNQKTLEELRIAISRYIGSPSEDLATSSNVAEPNRQNVKRSICFSAVISVFFALFMAFVSGEYHLNISLSLFAIVITSVLCILACLYFILLDKNWNNRPPIVNMVFLLGLSFFLSYSIMAFGLCFVSFDVFSLNYPSIICAVLSIYGLIQLMAFRKYGYRILWICVILFSIGSYWWLMHSIIVPISIAIIGTICMLFLTGILKIRHNGVSMWSRLS